MQKNSTTKSIPFNGLLSCSLLDWFARGRFEKVTLSTSRPRIGRMSQAHDA
jgi:hypothetical protein